MKAFLCTALMVLFIFGTAVAEKTRVSIMFIHYSVGNQIVYDGYCAYGYDRPLGETLDTTIVSYGKDTARIVFRDYNMNYWATGPLSDTVITCEGAVRIDNFNYDLNSPQYNRMKIWNSWDGIHDQYAGILKEFFNVPDKENQPFWTMFSQHDIPGVNGGTVSEKYDLIIIKNPFACWAYMTPAQADSIRTFYKIVRDSIANHPEMNICLAFGTPRVLYDTFEDSAQAKLTYNLATWFASDSFFTHTNDGQYKNLWKYDSYRFLCETSPDSVNRYCLKSAYSAAPGDSHLSLEAARISQDSLIAFIKRATRDILIQKSGAEGCVCQNRGNVDGQTGPTGPIDIADLTYLTAFLFLGGAPPPCEDEANVDGLTILNQKIDISDLVYLTTFLYADGNPPPPCN